MPDDWGGEMPDDADADEWARTVEQEWDRLVEEAVPEWEQRVLSEDEQMEMYVLWHEFGITPDERRDEYPDWQIEALLQQHLRIVEARNEAS